MYLHNLFKSLTELNNLVVIKNMMNHYKNVNKKFLEDCVKLEKN